jgi:hypothetical protein
MPKTRENKKPRRCNCTEPVCRRALRVPPSGCQCMASGPHEGVVNMIRSFAGRLETAHTLAQFADVIDGLRAAIESVQRLAGARIVDVYSLGSGFDVVVAYGNANPTFTADVIGDLKACYERGLARSLAKFERTDVQS